MMRAILATVFRPDSSSYRESLEERTVGTIQLHISVAA